jgi:hypothetical protein
MPRLSGRAGRLLLAASSVLLCLLAVGAAEWVSRGLFPDYLVQTRGLHVFSRIYGWAQRRGVSTTIEGHTVSLNARGYRGRELTLPRETNRTRVVVIGDSIAFGLDVSDDETFTHLLDARDNGIEAGNLAVQGYGPGQELLVLQNDALRYQPDIVVCAFCLSNDFADAQLEVSLYDGRTPKPRFRLVGDRVVLDDEPLRLSFPLRVFQWLSDYSHVFNRISRLGGDETAAAAPRHWRDRKRDAMRDEEKALRLNLELVRRMDAVCRRRGIALLVAVFPNGLSYQRMPWVAERFIERLRDEGIDVVDMSARFRALGLRPRTTALDGIGHLNVPGHTYASEVLEREIADRADALGR